MKGFLKNIELLEEEAKPSKESAVQHIINFEEEKHQAEWSPLYYSLANLEKLVSLTEVKEVKPSQVAIQLL
jgi:hypothetical protein